MRKVADYVLADASHGAGSKWHTESPDNRMYAVFASRGYSDGDSQVTMQFAPHADGCDAIYSETFVWESSCAVVREELLSALKFRGTLNDKTLVLANENGVDSYLTPAGKTGNLCIVTRREMVF